MTHRDMIEALDRMVEVSIERELSILHALSETHNRISSYSLVVDDRYSREFSALFIYLQRAWEQMANELLWDSATEKLREKIAESDQDIGPIRRSMFVGFIRELSFIDVIQPGNRSEIVVQNVLEPANISDEGISPAFEIYVSAVEEVITEIDGLIREEISAFVAELDDIIPEEPEEQDWQDSLSILHDKFVDLDKQARYIGDVQ